MGPSALSTSRESSLASDGGCVRRGSVFRSRVCRNRSVHRGMGPVTAGVLGHPFERRLEPRPTTTDRGRSLGHSPRRTGCVRREWIRFPADACSFERSRPVSNVDSRGRPSLLRGCRLSPVSGTTHPGYRRRSGAGGDDPPFRVGEAVFALGLPMDREVVLREVKHGVDRPRDELFGVAVTDFSVLRPPIANRW